MSSLINLHSPISYDIGYGVVALEIFRGLVRAGMKPIYWPIADRIPQSMEIPDDARELQLAIDRQDEYANDIPTLTIWHQHAMEKRIGHVVNAGLSFFERNNLTRREINSLNTQDRIIAPSSWAAEIMGEHLEVPIDLVHMGVDCEFFHYSPIIEKRDQDYIFLNTGKIEVRKGHDILIDMFNAAFEPSDQVQLWMSWDNPFLGPEETKAWQEKYLNTKMGSKIRFVPKMPRADLVKLYNVADCGIFPTRAEGLGLPILELMACGKPVITTNYSAMTDYLTRDTAFLVDVDEMEDAHDGRWFNGEGQWAKLGDNQQEAFIGYMRRLYQFRLSSLPGARLHMQKFSWDATVSKIMSLYR